jgi:hypothetical protein
MRICALPLSFQSGFGSVNGLSHHVWRVSLVALSALAVQAVAPATASVDLTSLATEVMIEDTASNNLIVGALFNPSSHSSLSYTTDLMSNGDYTYSTVSGSTLDGKSISLSGGATYSNPSPGVWDWDTYEDGDYEGSPYWYVVDHETVTQDPDGYYTIVSDYDYYDEDNNKLGDLHIIVVTDPEVTVDADYGYFTDPLGNKVPMSDFYSASILDEDTGDWDIEIWPGYPPPYKPPGMPDPIVSTGYTPLGGGDGYFTASFVPEPSTWVMMLLGFVGLGFAGYRSHRGMAAPGICSSSPSTERKGRPQGDPLFRPAPSPAGPSFLHQGRLLRRWPWIAALRSRCRRQSRPNA